MKRFYFCIFFLAAFLVPTWALEFTIQSPDKGDVWPKSSMVNRSLRWSEKKKVLTAEVTFSTANYSGFGESAQTESYDFTIPGVTYDPQQKTFSVTAPNGQVVVIAQRTKMFIGSRIDLLKVATIHISRYRTELTLSLQVNTVPPIELPDSDGSETKSVPLDSVISH